jgi:hypothetical protein
MSDNIDAGGLLPVGTPMADLGERIRELVAHGEGFFTAGCHALAQAAVMVVEARGRFDNGERDGCATWGESETRTGLSARRARQLLKIGLDPTPGKPRSSPKRHATRQIGLGGNAFPLPPSRPPE